MVEFRVPAATGRTTILVVEDDSDLRAFYRASLSTAGYAVVAVEDGLDALRHIEGRGMPDAVVLDLDLPRVSGRDVHHELAAHAETAKIPVVVVTGSDISDLNPRDFACILRKPINIEVLVHAIEDCLKPAGAARVI